MTNAVRDLVAVGALAGLLAAGIATVSSRAARREREVRSPTSGAIRLAADGVSFRMSPTRGTLIVRTHDRLLFRGIELSIVVDGEARPLLLRDVSDNGKEAVVANVAVDVEGASISVSLGVSVDRPRGAMAIRADVPRFPDAHPHAVALRAEVSTEGDTLFVAGVGEVADYADVAGPIVVLASEPHPLGFLSTYGPLEVHVAADARGAPRGRFGSSSFRAALTTPHAVVLDGASDQGPWLTDLRVVLGASPARFWRDAYQVGGTAAARVHGRVTGTTERARVFGLDALGAPQVRATTDAAGNFELYAPPSLLSWYASVDPARASEPTKFAPGTAEPLVLDLSPGGELRVAVTDADTHAPLTARLIVHGIDGTPDPSFGPDYRASGAGPLIDALRGSVTTPLPSGRYRVSATRGIEWSIDASEVAIASGHRESVALALRHVVPTPGVVGCDLHVHARPSFDTPVTTEDRVLSLVAAGVDFAVPTEHNVVGDYGPSLALLSLTPNLAWVSGVEVTTYSPRIGHFGVFPYPPGPVPPYRATTVSALVAAARRGDSSRVVQVHHPRLPHGIGYFATMNFNPESGRIPPGMRTDFDAIEVYNGYDLGAPERVAAVMKDWFSLLNRGSHLVATGSSDSHRIQYHWAGFPRTFVSVGANHDRTDDPSHPLDSSEIVSSLKSGHATVSNGPLVNLSVGSAGPGDQVGVDGDRVSARVRVHAAPWVDVTSVDIVVSGRIVRSVPIASRPTHIGPEPGSLEDAQQRTLRLDEVLDVPIGGTDAWMCAVAHGTRTLDDVLPFMPVTPLGFTNPVWFSRRKRN